MGQFTEINDFYDLLSSHGIDMQSGCNQSNRQELLYLPCSSSLLWLVVSEVVVSGRSVEQESPTAGGAECEGDMRARHCRCKEIV